MTHSVSMTPERWQRLQTLFHQVLELEPQARGEFIARECVDDHAMREQLLSLLIASDGDDQIEAQVETAIADSLLHDADMQPGQMIGRYKVAELIGRGGMGAVYLADRADEQFNQRVAVKVVADGALSGRMLARFRSERQILANLNHPNIARLLDGGTTSDGLPYLVMEYVAGQRIDQYCDEHELAIAQRLKLFLQVCAAIQHAHQQLIIHRDIKPTNILVTPEGMPKLLDFGIAKLIDPGTTTATQDTVLTRVHERVLTPDYASPEQVRGEHVGTASDVYALGVLLYELLTGFRPFELAGMSFEQIEKIICGQTPVKPSAVAININRDRSAATRAAIARQLRGDLDTIVMKALHKDMARRYASVDALSDDVNNYLARRPINAQPDSFGYRAHKFWQRNRLATLSATTVLLAIIALTVFYTWRLEGERDNAAAEAAKFKQISAFMADMFRSADPDEEDGKQVTALDLLDRGAVNIQSQLKDQPLVRAKLVQQMGESYLSLGATDKAEAMFQKALQIVRDEGLTGTSDYAKALYQLADIKDTVGDLASAEKLFKEALPIQRQHHDEEPMALVATLRGLAYVYSQSARNKDAVPLLEEAQTLIIEHGAVETVDNAKLANDMQIVFQSLKDYRRSEEYGRLSLRLNNQLLGRRHSETITSKLNLASLLRTTGHYRDSLILLEELVADHRSLRSPDHYLLGIALIHLGTTLINLGEYERADQALHEAIDIFEAKIGVDNRQYGSALRWLGWGEVLRGRYHDGERHLRLSGSTDERLMPAGNEQFFRNDLLLARALRGQGKDAEANALIGKAVKFFGEQKNKDVYKDIFWQEAGYARYGTQKWNEAAAFFKQGLAELDADGIAETRTRVELLQGLSEARLQIGEIDSAVKDGRHALDIATRLFPASSHEIAIANSVYGAALLRAGRKAEAEPLLKESYVSLQKVRKADDPVVKAARSRLDLLRS